MESKLVDHALTSLPAMIEDVTTKYKDYTAEINKHQRILKETMVRGKNLLTTAAYPP